MMSYRRGVYKRLLFEGETLTVIFLQRRIKDRTVVTAGGYCMHSLIKSSIETPVTRASFGIFLKGTFQCLCSHPWMVDWLTSMILASSYCET